MMRRQKRVFRRAKPDDDGVRHRFIRSPSARPSNVIGKVTPSVLAVFRLMTNSTLTTCWTGKSANDRAAKDSLAPDMLSLTLREKSPRSAYTPGDSERRVRPQRPPPRCRRDRRGLADDSSVLPLRFILRAMRRRRQLQHPCVLTFTEPSDQQDSSVRKF
jgi:hypothetical protein